MMPAFSLNVRAKYVPHYKPGLSHCFNVAWRLKTHAAAIDL
jgi:hypothetical protein